MTRSTAARDKKRSTPIPVVAKAPVNRLTVAERQYVLTLLNCDRFVDQAPLEIYAQLPDEGTYVCSEPGAEVLSVRCSVCRSGVAPRPEIRDLQLAGEDRYYPFRW
ncbi:hypothetical protein [Gordonia hirsuta]|uniref:hypothetical protein n=1 Tax=Gordonia hirsuta TaxID=53427 RepID=UPI0012DC3E8F|nr:hypothetical protein [Gordonia hirsuta]